jgi:hypothetical protein
MERFGSLVSKHGRPPFLESTTCEREVVGNPGFLGGQSLASIIWKTIVVSMYEFCTDGSAPCAREAVELIESPRRSAWGMDSKVEIHAGRTCWLRITRPHLVIMTLRARDPPAPTLRSRISGKRRTCGVKRRKPQAGGTKEDERAYVPPGASRKPEDVPHDDEPRRRMGVWRVAALEFP